MGERQGEDPSRCQICKLEWSLQRPLIIAPRSAYATICSCCDGAGRVMHCRSEQAIKALPVAERAHFTQLADSIRVQRTHRFAGQKLRSARRCEA